MTGPLLLGALFGLGVIAVVAWLAPVRPSLGQVFAALHPQPRAPRAPSLVPAQADAGWAAAIGRPAVPLLARAGLPRTRVLSDLAVCGRDPVRHLGEQAAMALIALLTVPAVLGLLALGGVFVDWQLPVWAALILLVAGLFLPDLALSSEAAKRRAELRDATAEMLDLVAIALAGGAGIEQALREATQDAATWGQSVLRQAIEAAHLMRTQPWATLGQLGETTGVQALVELAGALSLAGGEGARIKTTLTARSAALAAHQIADAEAAATSATEYMVFPIVILMSGFLLFIGYPAFATVMGAL